MVKCKGILWVLAVLLWSAGTGVAAYHVTVDLSAFNGADVELETALYDNSGVVGDSHARLDNLVLAPATDDFEDGTLGAVNDNLNPASVGVASGQLHGTGDFVMTIDEDPDFTPTIAYRDYLDPTGNELAFDFDMAGSSLKGFWGLDELVFSLRDPETGDPLVPGLTGTGDVLAVTARGMWFIDIVDVEAITTTIPAPGALLLGMLGLGVARLRKIA